MYSLNCSFYTDSFPTLEDLILDIQTSGMDPSYEITKDGKGIGETAMDHIQP